MVFENQSTSANPPVVSHSSSLTNLGIPEVQVPVVISNQEYKPDPPPDGGLTAWLQVLGSFCIFFNTWGMVNAFGVFQTYYTTSLLADQSASSISWIGSILSLFISASPLLFGPIFDLGYSRLLVFGGTFLSVFGYMMTSLCTQYYQFILAQAICVGIGGGSSFIAGIAILPTYFTTKRAIAIGIAASGSSLAGVIYPIVFNQLLPKIGFGWTVRVMAFIALGTLSVACVTIKSRIDPRSQLGPKRKFFQAHALKDAGYWFFNAGVFFGFIGQYIPFFYLELYARNYGISDQMSFYMLAFLSTGSIFGRIIPSYFATNMLHPMVILGFCGGVAAILSFCWMAITSLPGLIVFALLYGFFSGAFVSLQPASISRITKDMSTIGTRMGVNNSIAAVGILIGNPVAGAIVARSWQGTQAFCGITLLLASVLIFVAKVAAMRAERAEAINEEEKS